MCSLELVFVFAGEHFGERSAPVLWNYIIFVKPADPQKGEWMIHLQLLSCLDGAVFKFADEFGKGCNYFATWAMAHSTYSSETDCSKVLSNDCDYRLAKNENSTAISLEGESANFNSQGNSTDNAFLFQRVVYSHEYTLPALLPVFSITITYYL